MGFVASAVDSLFGGGAKAAEGAADAQVNAQLMGLNELRKGRTQGFSFIDEYLPTLKMQGLGNRHILTDPFTQIAYLKKNPLFKEALENANRETMSSAAARGRLSAGDTQRDLANNVLLSAMPLLDRQQANVMDLLGLGTNLAQYKANIAENAASRMADVQSNIGDAIASGKIGAANSRSESMQNAVSTGLSIAGMAMMFSDRRLKKDIIKIGKKGRHNLYSFTWTEQAEDLGFTGKAEGVIADEVEKIQPEAVYTRNGYKCVDYRMLS